MSATQTVARRDLRAGEGAKFLVEWVSNKRVSAPIVESVMIGSGTQGISFKSRGEVIRQR